MAYQLVQNVGSPNEVLGKIRDFALANGWTVLENLTSDPSIDGTVTEDGLRLSVKAPSGDVVANFRSANGKPIFDSQANTNNAYGIGLVCSTDYTANPPSGKWYDQPGATKQVRTQEVIGVGIPCQKAGTTPMNLYLNAIANPAPLLAISLEILPGLFQHLVVADTQKIGSWSGGCVYSGSRNSWAMFTAAGFARQNIEAESNHLLGMSEYASTFLRCDIDAAPLRLPAVLWASAGADNPADVRYGYTGKILGLPVKKRSIYTDPAPIYDPKIPHYGYLQSQTATDTGRNVNTLNCITVNLPLALYVQRDPDGLRNFSQCGYVPGAYFISTRNVAPGQTYEISYPQSGQLHQAFPHTSRGGVFGYDGLSIKQ